MLRNPFAVVLLSIFLLAASGISSAATEVATPSGAAVLVRNAVLIDVATGEVLYEKSSHVRADPASMVKMLVVLLALEDIQRGRASMEDRVTVSAAGAAVGGHQIYLKEGEVFTLYDLLKAVLIGSANDATYTVAEYLGGGDAGAFVERMNERAAQLGMRDSHFYNPHGLPPAKGQNANYTSAYDMTLVARALLKHPQALKWSSVQSDTLRNGAFALRNTNHHFLRSFHGGDGLKTGFTGRAGFCVTATAERDGRRLLAVVMGANNVSNRVMAVSDLLEWGFTGKVVHTARAIPVKHKAAPKAKVAPKKATVKKATVKKPAVKAAVAPKAPAAKPTTTKQATAKKPAPPSTKQAAASVPTKTATQKR